MCIIIGIVHQFIGHCLINLDLCFDIHFTIKVFHFYGRLLLVIWWFFFNFSLWKVLGQLPSLPAPSNTELLGSSDTTASIIWNFKVFFCLTVNTLVNHQSYQASLRSLDGFGLFYFKLKYFILPSTLNTIFILLLLGKKILLKQILLK